MQLSSPVLKYACFTSVMIDSVCVRVSVEEKRRETIQAGPNSSAHEQWQEDGSGLHAASELVSKRFINAVTVTPHVFVCLIRSQTTTGMRISRFSLLLFFVSARGFSAG